MKIMGFLSESVCGRCNNSTARQIIKLTNWLTLFFIPIIPYQKRYLLVCPICSQTQDLTKSEFNSLIGGLQTADGLNQNILSDEIKYAGKTPTQIAFLKQMEEVNRNRD